MTGVTAALRGQLAPTGVLRAALNHGNRVLVTRDGAGQARGITVDLAHRLADLLEVPLEFVHRERAVDVSSIAGEDVYDICFLAVDPKRAEVLHFTQPYLQIEGAYLAGPECKAEGARALVASGARVGTVEGSAYTLDLMRKPGAGALEILPGIDAALAALRSGRVAAIAGIRSVMAREAEAIPDARVLEPAFMTIRQAMAMPRRTDEAHAFLDEFVASLSRTGEIAALLERNGVDATCAPPAP